MSSPYSGPFQRRRVYSRFMSLRVIYAEYFGFMAIRRTLVMTVDVAGSGTAEAPI